VRHIHHAAKFSAVPLGGLVQLVELLVPRTSSTPVATWSWTTWEVESETCVGSHVHLVGASISFEKNFIGSHSLPLSSAPNRP
jgi:hypothetical protein